MGQGMICSKSPLNGRSLAKQTVVVVSPAAVVVVVARALPDFDFVLTAVLVVAPGAVVLRKTEAVFAPGAE